MKQFNYIIIFSIILSISCHSDYKYVDEDKFIGEWELKGRSSFSGMQIKITEDSGNLKGIILKVSNSKYAKLFAEEGDLWVKKLKEIQTFHLL